MRKKELKPRISVGATAAAVFVSNGISVLNVVKDDGEKKCFCSASFLRVLNPWCGAAHHKANAFICPNLGP